MSGIDEQPVGRLEKPKGRQKRELDLYGKLLEMRYGYTCEKFVYSVKRE